MFAVGQELKTNKAYQERFNRVVHGTVFSSEYEVMGCTILIWQRQEGKVIPENQDKPVLMLTDDLESEHLQ